MSAGPAQDGLPAVLRTYRYKPRTVAFQGVRAFGRWRVKLTVVTLRGTAVHFGEEIEGACAEAERLLDALGDGAADAGIASLVVHIGRAGVGLLLDWWEQGDVLMHRHVFAPLDDPARFADVAMRHIGPSVWDLAIQAHERQAWISHVLANAAGPDIDAYLADGLTGVF